MALPTKSGAAAKISVIGYPVSPIRISADFYAPPQRLPGIHPIRDVFDYVALPPAAFPHRYCHSSPPNYEEDTVPRWHLIFAALTSVFVFAVFILAAWILLKPHLPEFRVDSAASNGLLNVARSLRVFGLKDA